MDKMPLISIGISIIIALISFFLKRELDNKDRAIQTLETRIKSLEDKTNHQEVMQEKLNGRIDTVIEILERLEKKLETMS